MKPRQNSGNPARAGVVKAGIPTCFSSRNFEQQAVEGSRKPRPFSATRGARKPENSGAGSLPLEQRDQTLFADLVTAYEGLFSAFPVRNGPSPAQLVERTERIAYALGDAFAGARDLIDVHLAALNRAVAGESEARSRALATEGRLVALEVMALLADYYRAGPRRRQPCA